MIASAFLTSPTAMGQRLVPSKDKIRQAAIPFRIPEREELPDRLGGGVGRYLRRFLGGLVDSGGTDAARRDMAEEALFLGQLLTQLLRKSRKPWGWWR